MQPLICVKLNGGLGNQLFQYATARALVNNSGKVLLDVTNYGNNHPTKRIGLSSFQINAFELGNKWSTKIFHNGTRVTRLLSAFGLFSSIKEDVFKVDKNIENRVRFLTQLDGYWQSSDYFNHIRSILLKEIEPKQKPCFPAFIDSSTIAVHVRRTDYMKDDRYGFIGTEYYKRAIHFLSQKIANPKFLIFSDDLNWCKNYFKGENIRIFDDPEWGDDYLQLYLMSKFPHQIIANSSFSWWSAWLNQNPGKMIIRPLAPFQDSSLLYENYYPINWIAL